MNQTATMQQTVEFRQLNACEAALALMAKDRGRAHDVLKALSRAPSSVVRRRAAECLTELGDEEAVATLSHLLDDPNGGVRATAILALGLLRVHSATAVLIRRLETDRSIEVQLAAARALGRLGDRAGLTLALGLLNGKNERYRRLAVAALRDIIGQKFSRDQAGIKAARRYLEVQGEKLFSGDIR